MTIAAVRIPGPPALCVDVAGPDGAPLVLFLHGIGGNRSNWRPQLEALGDRYWTVAWDARGYGDSEDSPAPLTFTDFADDAARVITWFGREKAHVVGLSMGGRIALDLWRRYPGRIASLTLADTSAGSSETSAPDKVDAFLAARRQPLVDGRTTAEIAPGIVDKIAGPSITPDVHAQLIASHAALRPDSYIATMEVVTRFTDFPDFTTIDVPTLVIVGTEDRIAPPHVAEAMAASIPGAVLEKLSGAGHISNLEAPDAFNAALRAFLERLA